MSKGSAINVEQLKECLKVCIHPGRCFEKGTSRVGIIAVEQRSVESYLVMRVKTSSGTKERVHVCCVHGEVRC